MWTTSRIRRHFLDYFGQDDHALVESSPLVPRNDPTLMFTSAGMVQFKNVFTGAEKRPYTRAATAQKCVRAGGKHNDLENVGYTSRHHTFFEMLGNFSFGDYFKEHAIEMAWNLVTKEFGLPVERLLVTVYIDDDEAFKLWQKIAGLPQEKIIRIAGSDNFWAMGDSGPCGPCSEIFYDHGAHIPGGPPGSPDGDLDRFVEIWNLVFMQYEQLLNADGTPGERVNLPKPSIDTGMGLERIAAVLQGVHANFEIDLFKALIAASEDLVGVKAEGKALPSHRVIADHLRASAFLIADGITPSNEGRGYVLRRIMRRAMRHAYILGCKDPLMHRLVPALVAEMGEAYPELTRAQSTIMQSLKLEEERFRQTLGRGLKLLEEETSKLGSSQALAGDVAFKLYDTYGFPLDLTQDILRSEGRSVDLDGFNAAMDKQKAEARASWAGSGEAASEAVWFQVRDKVGASDFLGYSTTSAQAVLRAALVNGQEVGQVVAGAEALLVFNQTPFYGESGGQMGDTGMIRFENGAVIEVLDTTRKAGDVFVHHVRLHKGTITLGDAATLEVDAVRRQLIRANHSATHLLHASLRAHLGDQVVQKGSLVAPDRLRFDFAYQEAVPAETLARIEDEVNDRIRANAPVITRLMSPEAAIAEGAMALFGEKYGEEVRVVSMTPEDQTETPHFSVELCGGTHVSRTGDIGYFKIVSESGIAAGIRRIEALTGPGAEHHMAAREEQLLNAASLMKTKPEDLATRLAQVIEERRKLEQQVKELQKQLAVGGSGGAAASTQLIAGVSFLPRTLEGVNPGELRGIADELKRSLDSGVVAVATSVEGKGSIVVGVTADLTTKLNAVDLARAAAQAMGGSGGGGRPDMAQAGGPNGHDLAEAMQAIARAMGDHLA
ncbi:MAG: alanine--tRNA ligase [Holosporales bacterium]